MQTKTNNVVLERYGVKEETDVERIGKLFDKGIKSMDGFKSAIDAITIEYGLWKIPNTTILGVAIRKALNEKMLIETIEMIKDYAKDNFKQTERLIGKDLLNTIINFKK